MATTPPTPPASTPTPPAVTQTGGTQSVQFTGDPKAREAEEAAKNNQQSNPGTATQERPEGLPEGFDSWEAYGQDRLAKDAPKDTTTGKDTPALTADQKAEADEALKDLPEANREKARPMFEEFARTGDLSDATVKTAAETFGVTEDMVRLYVAGAKGESAQSAEAAVTAAGTDMATFQQFQTWANEGGMDQAQLDAFNAGLQKDSAGTIKEAIAAWTEAGNGPGARDITRGERGAPAQNGAAGAQPYASTAEMQRDMGNPKYDKDPAFRAKVEARVGATSF